MRNLNNILWLNGVFLTVEQTGIDPTDRGFTLGDGVFDTMLAMNGAPVLAKEHFTRLHRHASVLKIPVPYTAEELTETAIRLLQDNTFTTGRYALRTTVTRGPGARGLTPSEAPSPTVLMTATPAPDPDSLPPLRAIIAQVTCRNEHSPLSRIKSLNYADNLLALLEARDKGADDAVLLNTAGHVTCTTTGNLFIEEKGVLTTPPLTDGVMDGVTRTALIEERGVIEESFGPQQLLKADAVYVTNSVVGMRRLLPLS